ncbi:unnamed protein product, partial [Vitis vinifera]|uniref:G protein gamma domain-containing protein n=1 Tax=Vitis vinifera TaxID=29760 RepID=D7TCE1_VITVI
MAGSSSMPSLPPPCPKSPPDYPDLYGKRRGAAKVQMLEREIGFLEEELKSIEGLQHASRCCKEVVDFVVANSDPIIPTNSKSRKSCRFWKWLWYIFSFPFFCMFCIYEAMFSCSYLIIINCVLHVPNFSTLISGKLSTIFNLVVNFNAGLPIS